MSKTTYVGFDTRRITFTGRCPERADTKLWAFGYADLADFIGCTENTIRGAVSRGHLDPGSLESIFAYKEGRRRSPVKKTVTVIKEDSHLRDTGPLATWDFLD
jgi:hypothetical protein